MENDKNSQLDLDICDITGRENNHSTNLVTVKEMQSAVATLKNILATLRTDANAEGNSMPLETQPNLNVHRGSLLRIRSDEQCIKQWRKEHDFSYRLEVSPGSMKVSRKLTNLDKERTRGKSPNYKQKTTIKEWSAKSRANMVARYGTLDYAPLFCNELQRPAMITLTYPDQWELVVPTGQHAKRHLLALKKRYQRVFNVPLYGLWKTEYQARGAVHFHLLCSPPNSTAFRKWLLETWADIVDHPVPEEKAKHILSGAHISYNEKYGGFDSRSISVYFSKHASPNGGSKEYQNQPPQLWKDGASIGRFWGYFGLKPAVWKISISFQEAVAVSRTLRRLSKRGRPGEPKLMRKKLVYGYIYTKDKTQNTGLLRRRMLKVPVKRFPSILGFITVSNGARTTRDLARVLALDRTGRC